MDSTMSSTNISEALRDVYDAQLKSAGVNPTGGRRTRRKPNDLVGTQTFSTDPDVLDAVRASLEKNKDHEVDQKNTFNPGQSPSVSQKKRSATRKSNPNVQDDDKLDPVKLKPIKKMNNADVPSINASEVEEAPPPPRPGKTQGARSRPRRPSGFNNAAEGTGRENPSFEMDEVPTGKRLRKPRSQPVESEMVEQTAMVGEDAENEPGEQKPKVKKRVKKRRPLTAQESQEEALVDPGGDVTEQPPTAVTSATETAGKILSLDDEGFSTKITIHRSDRLKTEIVISHPMVLIHIMDMTTGKYLKKQTRERKVTSYYEDPDRVDYILPIMTKPWEFKRYSSSVPLWEEALILDENFNYIRNNANAIIFFEVVDFLRANNVSNNTRMNQREAGWYRIAWAFYIPCPPQRPALTESADKSVDNKLRLQLYEPGVYREGEPDTACVYFWWASSVSKTGSRQSSSRRTPYPSTLYISLQGVRLAPPTDGTQRAFYPNQIEGGSLSWDPFALNSNATVDGDSGTSFQMPAHWTRLPGQMCRIPNRLGMAVASGSQGCSIVKFSPSGRLMAIACQSKANEYPILVYNFPEATKHAPMQLKGHGNLIYDLSWSRKGHYLASASADGTARVWQICSTTVTSGNAEEQLLATIDGRAGSCKILAHPYFVYSVQFHPRVSSLLVSGAFDKIIRVWLVDKTQVKVMQEINGHHGLINCVRFEVEGKRLYSADSVGCIFVWNCFVTEQPGSNPFVQQWTKAAEIKESELENVVINHLDVHPSGKKMLVHSRDNTLRMIDLRLSTIIQRYRGALGYRHMLRSCITPCGTFVISGSEDHRLYVWNAETGDRVAMYEVNLTGSICTVDYHPFDHSLAFSALVQNAPVLVYAYDMELARTDNGLPSPAENSPRHAKSLGLQINRAGLNITEERSTKFNETLRKQEERISLLHNEHSEADKHRLDMAMQRLNSVLQTSQTLRISDTPQSLSLRNPLSLTNTTSYHSTTPLDMNQSLSLHDQAQQLQANREYMAESKRPWRPDFVPIIGKSKTKLSAPSRPPTINITATSDKMQVNFHGLGKQMSNEPEPDDVVVALFDYIAERSDEVSFTKGDLIRVLYRDTDNWWMGQVLSTKEQGFFPTAYVTGSEDAVSQKPATDNNSIKTTLPASSKGNPRSDTVDEHSVLSSSSRRPSLPKSDKQMEGSGDDNREQNDVPRSRQRRSSKTRSDDNNRGEPVGKSHHRETPLSTPAKAAESSDVGSVTSKGRPPRSRSRQQTNREG